MKTYIIKLGETKQYSVDYAPLENGVSGASSNWLDRNSSPVEQLTSHTITLESPTGVSVSSSLTNSNTRVTYQVTGTAVGTYEVAIQANTTNSPNQVVIEVVVFKVVQP